MPKPTNTKLIIILTGGLLLFIVALAMLYFTFGNNPADSQSVQESTNTAVNTKTITNKTFEDDIQVQQISSLDVNIKIISSQNISSNTAQATSIISTSSKSSLSDVTNPDLKLPQIQKIDYTFESKDKEILGKYIKANFENKIISKLKDDKNTEILALRIPKSNIEEQVEKDFPKTFKFSNEDRKSQTKDSIFLYYTSEKRVAYLGEYVVNVQSFAFESKDYWLVQYDTQLLISKPNFANWAVINLDDVPILDVYKKSEFEFQIMKTINYENYEENKIEVISPQKYIIDGIFSPVSD
jgi:hypothetical protein